MNGVLYKQLIKIKTRGIEKPAEVGFIDYYCELLVIRHFYYKSFEVKDLPPTAPAPDDSHSFCPVSAIK